MDAVHYLFKVTVPNYFRSLPIPKSVDGFAKLNCEHYNAFSFRAVCRNTAPAAYLQSVQH